MPCPPPAAGPRPLLPLALALALSACAAGGPAGDSGKPLTPLDTGAPAEVGPHDDPRELQVATFNIEWLTVAQVDEVGRNATDYEMIRTLITENGLDLIALQEIEGDAAMEHLQLPSRYSWAAGSTGWSQNVVLVWRNDLLEVSEVREVDLPRTDGANKAPLAARVRHLQGDLAFTFVGLHHKAYTDDEAARERRAQTEDLAAWLDGELADDEEAPFAENVVLAGDFNDTFEGLNPSIRSLPPLQDELGYTFTTEAAETYTQIDFESLIDHIALSPALAGRWGAAGGDGPPAAGVLTHDLTSPWSDYSGGYRDTQNISDHRPLWIYLQTGAAR